MIASLMRPTPTKNEKVLVVTVRPTPTKKERVVVITVRLTPRKCESRVAGGKTPTKTNAGKSTVDLEFDVN